MESLRESNSFLREQNEILRAESHARLLRLVQVEDKLSKVLEILEKQRREIVKLKLALFGDDSDD